MTPVPDGNRHKDPQPNTGLSSGSPAKERVERLYEQGRVVKIMRGKPTETADLNFRELTDSGQTVGAVMGPI